MMKHAAAILLLAPLPAFAEVSDKMLTIPQLWLQGCVVAMVLLLLVRWSAWFVVLGMLVAAFFASTSYSMFAAPYIGPAIINEQGIPYIVSSYGSAILVGAGAIVGLVLNRRASKRKEVGPPIE